MLSFITICFAYNTVKKLNSAMFSDVFIYFKQHNINLRRVKQSIFNAKTLIFS